MLNKRHGTFDKLDLLLLDLLADVVAVSMINLEAAESARRKSTSGWILGRLATGLATVVQEILRGAADKQGMGHESMLKAVASATASLLRTEPNYGERMRLMHECLAREWD